MTGDSLRWEQVSVGDELPVLTFPITIKALALQAAGTRDFMPYHHHREFARSVGSRDAFVNTMFNQGLFGRFVTDWSGPESNLVSQTLQMTDQLCLGDIAEVHGRVAEQRLTDGCADVLLELWVTAGERVTARSKTVLAMPSAQFGAVGAPSLKPPKEPPDAGDVPEEVRDFIGVARRRCSPYPVSEAQIGYWCEMVRDGNPLYARDDVSRSLRLNGQIAPPTMLMTWGMPRGTQTGVDTRHPDVDAPNDQPWPESPPNEVGGYRMQKATEIIGVSTVSEYGEPVRPGDQITIDTSLHSCSRLRRTKLGLGYFVTNLSEFRAGDKLVGRVYITTLHYGVAEEES